jgi:hypothetical protein
MEEKYVDFSVQQLDTIKEAFKDQAQTAQASYKWVSALSALVRPSITYMLFGLYVAVKITAITYAINSGASWVEVLKENWTTDDFGMLNLVITFWFVGRAIERYQK